MDRSLWAVVIGTFTLRCSTALTGAMLAYYLDELHLHPGGVAVTALVAGLFVVLFNVADLLLSPLFGVLADRWGFRRVMQLGPLFGAVAVVVTAFTTNIVVLGTTRWLEGASTAASVPSILGFIALATATDEGLRGRAVARFEAATLGGLGAGFVIAGPLWQAIGPRAFLVNAVLYVVSLVIYRYGVRIARDLGATSARPARVETPQRYLRLLRSSHVWLLAPTWVAVNAAIGLWTLQSIIQLVGARDPRFGDQVLVGGFRPVEISLGFLAGGVIFFAGLFYWGDRFKRYRRTTILFYGMVGGAIMIGAALLFNHSAGMPLVARVVFALVVVAGLFVLAGATPAALGLLADISETHPNDRGAIMGLYNVFFSLGHIAGGAIGGIAAELAAMDGLLIASLVCIAVALLPLFHLRLFEHHLSPDPARLPAPELSPD